MNITKLENRNIESFKNTKNGLLFGFFENFNSEKTKIAYWRDINDFFNYLKSQKVSIVVTKIKPEHAVLYKEYLSRFKRFKPTTINRKLCACSSFWKYLTKRKIVTENIFGFVNKKKVDVISKTRALENEEVRSLLSVWKIRKAYNDYLYSAVLHTLFFTGIRKAELQNLKISDLKRNNGFCSILIKNKGGAVIERRLHNDALEKILEFLEVRMNEKDTLIESEYLFVAKNSKKKISANFIDHIFKISGKYSGVGAWITPHVARATFISRLLDENTVQSVSLEIAHKSIKTTMGYYNRKFKVENSISKDISFE